MKRPQNLNQMPLSDAISSILGGRGVSVITMSIGQWDALLAGCYEHGHILLELDGKETPVAAYRREGLA